MYQYSKCPIDKSVIQAVIVLIQDRFNVVHFIESELVDPMDPSFIIIIDFLLTIHIVQLAGQGQPVQV